MMDKEKLLSVRWSNRLAMGLGIPALVYAITALSTSLASGPGGFIGMVVTVWVARRWKEREA